MTDEKNEGYYITKDLYEIAVLTAVGCKLHISQLDQESKEVHYYFHDPAVCKKVVQKYWEHALEVNAKDLVDAIKKCKSDIFTLARGKK